MANNTTYSLIWAIRDLPSININFHEKYLLLILASFTTNKNKFSWYSHKSIAEKTGLSLSTTKRTLKSLEQKKYISVFRHSKNNTKQTNSYQINVEKILNTLANINSITVSDRPTPQVTISEKGSSVRPIKKKEKKKEKKGFFDNTQQGGAPLQAPPAADSVLDLDRLKNSKLGKYLTKNTLNKIQG